jgi:hypothetical protein
MRRLAILAVFSVVLASGCGGSDKKVSNDTPHETAIGRSPPVLKKGDKVYVYMTTNNPFLENPTVEEVRGNWVLMKGRGPEKPVWVNFENVSFYYIE